MALFRDLSPRMARNAVCPETLCLSGFQSDFPLSCMAASLGFEPRQADSESAVLPLHHEAKSGGGTVADVGRLSTGENVIFERGWHPCRDAVAWWWGTGGVASLNHRLLHWDASRHPNRGNLTGSTATAAG